MIIMCRKHGYYLHSVKQSYKQTHISMDVSLSSSSSSSCRAASTDITYIQPNKVVNKHTLQWMFLCHHHHHHVVPQARTSLTLSRHFFLSFIASGISSGLHPISSHSCCIYVLAGRPALARPYVGSIGVHNLWARLCSRSSVLLARLV